MRHISTRLVMVTALWFFIAGGMGASAHDRVMAPNNNGSHPRVAAQAAGHVNQAVAQAPDPVTIQPVRGQTKWAIIMCKFSDKSAEPQPASYFQKFFTEAGRGTGGMFDYWNNMSYGAVDLTGSVVKGWYVMPYSSTVSMSRSQRIDACINAGKNDFNFPDFYGIIAVTNAVTDSGAIPRQDRTLNGVTKTYGLVLLDPWAWNVSFAGHEMGHGYGLDHSFDAALSACGAQPGEYCDKWDIMSAMNIYTYQGSYGDPGSAITFSTGPQLNAAYRDKLGWLLPDQQFVIDNMGASAIVRLRGLDNPPASGWLMAKIFYDPTDHSHYYTVEFRRKVGWDQGIPRDALLIHDWNPNGHSYLIAASPTKDLGVGQSFQDPAHNIMLTVNAMDSTTAIFTFRPISLFVATSGNDANTCLSPSSPCRTIVAAVNKAPASGTISIAPGIYQEHFVIDRPVILTGQNVVVR